MQATILYNLNEFFSLGKKGHTKGGFL